MFSNINILESLQFIIIIFLSIWFHEYAHAITSYKLGDPTPKYQWRLTLNPIAHVDPVWWILILFVILSWRGIWRGKPVEINPRNYKDPVRWELLVAIAWPAMNILLAILSSLVFFIYAKISWFSLTQIFYQPDRFSYFFILFANVNIWLAVFNLIPIWPLDGFSILKVFWYRLAELMMQYRQIISIVLLLLILWPTWNDFLNVLGTIRSFIFEIIFNLRSSVFY
jgi:Zn-dependent protease